MNTEQICCILNRDSPRRRNELACPSSPDDSGVDNDDTRLFLRDRCRSSATFDTMKRVRF